MEGYMSKIKIAKRIIEKGAAPFIIAEAGINHNGELAKALQMIKVAKRAGADVIKFQTSKAEEFICDPKLEFTYMSQGKEVTESMLRMFKRCELKRKEWFLIKEQCDKEQIVFMSTPQNQSDLDLLLEIGIPAIKVGADDFINLPLIKGYAKAGLPLFLSSGMADLGEIYKTLEIVGAFDGYPTVLMLCTSEYPTSPENVNLLKLKTLESSFPNIILGFSDHTQGPLASSLAAAMGAVVFEKHFTLDHNLPGPDHWFSADPKELEVWVKSIKTSFKMLGSEVVRPTENEVEIRIAARRSIVALSDIKKGERLNEKNIGLRRPGNGLAPAFLEKTLGLKAAKSLKKGDLLKIGDFV
jgi:N,N'-diacetyllegionaminate synthase